MAHRGSCADPPLRRKLTDCGELLQSVREGAPMRPEDCPAVKRLRDEEEAQSEY